jgi:hypothetical protein
MSLYEQPHRRVQEPGKTADTARPAPRMSQGPAAAPAGRLGTLQAVLDGSPQVRQLAAMAHALHARPPAAPSAPAGQPSVTVVQRQMSIGTDVIDRIAVIRKYKAYKRLPLGERSQVDHEFFALREQGNFKAGSEEELIEELRRLARVRENTVFKTANAVVPNEAPETFRKTSFDDDEPLVIYRFVSQSELEGLKETIRTEQLPVFKHRGDRKDGEKFFATNKRYVWSQWSSKGKRAKDHPKMLKVVLRPGVRAEFLHNPESAGLHESARDAYQELGELGPQRAQQPLPVAIKRESKDKKAALTSLNYGFRGRGDDNAGLTKLAEYITAIEVVSGDELDALKDPNTDWQQDDN